MTLDELTASFDHLDRDALLEGWHWLTGESQSPILLTASGNAFIQDVDTGTVSFLDLGEGDVTAIADSFDEFKSLLSDKEFISSYFDVQMVGDLRASGCLLSSGQIYSLTQPAVLGGEYALSNIVATDIDVHFSVSGQLHHQVAALPDGSPVENVLIK